MPSFTGLKLFRDIAQTRSLSRAAELNRITPSAASQQVQEMERHLGVKLLDRSSRPVAVTREGELYDKLCRDILRLNDEFRASLDEFRSLVEGTVRVAAIYSVRISEIARLEAELQRRLPQVRLEVDYLRPEKVYEYVTADRVDLGLVSYPESTHEVEVIPWREEEMVVAMAPSHPLAAKTTLAPTDLSGQDFIGFDDDLPIARGIARYLKTADVQVNAAFHFDNIQNIKEAVMFGSGVSLVPRCILLEELADKRIAAVSLEEPGLYRPVGIIHRRNKKFHRAAQAFLELLQETPATSD